MLRSSRRSLLPCALRGCCFGASSAPNRVRDLTPGAAHNSTFGTLSIRRVIGESVAAGFIDCSELFVGRSADWAVSLLRQH